jgi:acetyl-CoA acetyltransferase family protein
MTAIREQGSNIGRLALLKAGYPVSVASVQCNRMGGTGIQALIFACQEIASGDVDMNIACGVEMMSVVPMTSDMDLPSLMNAQEVFHPFPYKFIYQAMSAEMVADKYGVTKDDMDSLAIRSHELSHHANEKGYWKDQILTIKLDDGSILKRDEGIRYPVDSKKLKSLKPIAKEGGKITPANSSQISDGAAAILLCSGKKADQLGLKKRARVVARAVVGSDPTIQLDGVIPATKKVLAKAGLSIDDIDVFEIVEAFSSVPLAWKNVFNVPLEKINPNGGAMAEGHPIAATGIILTMKVVGELERTGKRYGLVCSCIGHGMSVAAIVENCSYIK